MSWETTFNLLLFNLSINKGELFLFNYDDNSLKPAKKQKTKRILNKCLIV